jgi:hypothetical protein
MEWSGWNVNGAMGALDLPRTLDHGRAELPASWHHRLAGSSDGFHELARGPMPDRAVGSFTIVQPNDRTPTLLRPSTSGPFRIPGILGLARRFAFTALWRRRTARWLDAAERVSQAVACWRFRSGCSTLSLVRLCAMPRILWPTFAPLPRSRSSLRTLAPVQRRLRISRA